MDREDNLGRGPGPPQQRIGGPGVTRKAKSRDKLKKSRCMRSAGKNRDSGGGAITEEGVESPRSSRSVLLPRAEIRLWTNRVINTYRVRAQTRARPRRGPRVYASVSARRNENLPTGGQRSRERYFIPDRVSVSLLVCRTAYLPVVVFGRLPEFGTGPE